MAKEKILVVEDDEDILELIPGVYTLKIIGVNGESFRKIIKN